MAPSVDDMATTASIASSNAPDQRHLRLLTASVSRHESRIHEVLAHETWPTAGDLDTLRQALVKVSTWSSLKTVRLLIDLGADVNPKKENEPSALFRAAEVGHLAVVVELLEQHADPDRPVKTGQTALFRAAEGGHLAVVAALLKHKADPNWRARNGQTALFLACLRGHNAVVKALLDGGADPDGGRDKDGRAGDRDGRTPLLFVAAEKSSKWTMDTVRILLQRGADPNARDATKRTPLHWAATNGHLDLARCLLGKELRKKAEIDATQNRGRTALHLASENNKLEIVEFLLAEGANVDARSDGRWTPLVNAADSGHTDVVARLLAYGADVNAELSNRMTALHWASFKGHQDVVQLLLDRPETNLYMKDQFERTPMICAAEGHHKRIVEMLSPARHAHRLSESAREATKRFEATVVDFGEFNKFHRKDDLREQKSQLVFKNHSVYDVLYGWDAKNKMPTVPVLTKSIKWEPKFRWIHLPANNIAWIETLLAKSFIEGEHKDVEGFKALGKCFDQEHRGPLAHANFMRTYCHCVPSRRADKQPEDGSLGVVKEHMQPTDFAARPGQAAGPEASALTDHSETSTGRQEGSSSSGKRKPTRSEQIAERHPSRPKKTKGHPGNPPGSKEAKLKSRQSSFAPSFASAEAFKQLANNGKMVLFMPFLHYENYKSSLKMAQTIQRARRGEKPPPNASRDELLIYAYMRNHLHPRRTLDQFFYRGIDTTQRDSDQVVYRFCQRHWRHEDPKLFMVDQLWMWILGGETVITCFPQRWDQPKQDPLNVVDGVIEETNAKTRPPIQSVYDLAMVITNRCAGTFDRHRLDEQQFQFLDMFESSIGNVTDEESKLFDKFNAASRESTMWLNRYRRQDGDDQFEHEFSDDLLNIHQETKLLAEIKDIQDELNIIMVVLMSQLSVLREFHEKTKTELQTEGPSRKTTDAILKDIKARFLEQERLIEVHKNDIFRMNAQAGDIKDSLTSLLDLKQKHSNALEARFAREQAIIASKQGQTIMVFTIVTIIFLPMSFIAAFFAIELEDWGDRLTIAYVSKYIIGIGLAISFLFIAAAFLVHDISDAFKTLGRVARSWIPKRGSLKNRRGPRTRQVDTAASPRGIDNKPGTVAASMTACASAEDVDWKKPPGRAGQPDHFVSRMSRDRDLDRHEMSRLGLSPMRYGARKLSMGSERGWSRGSFDGRRGRFSGDLERGRVY